MRFKKRIEGLLSTIDVKNIPVLGFWESIWNKKDYSKIEAIIAILKDISVDVDIFSSNLGTNFVDCDELITHIIEFKNQYMESKVIIFWIYDFSSDRRTILHIEEDDFSIVYDASVNFEKFKHDELLSDFVSDAKKKFDFIVNSRLKNFIGTQSEKIIITKPDFDNMKAIFQESEIDYDKYDRQDLFEAWLFYKLYFEEDSLKISSDERFIIVDSDGEICDKSKAYHEFDALHLEPEKLKIIDSTRVPLLI